MNKKWLSIYEAYLARHDLVPLMIEQFGMNYHPAGQQLILERAKLCRTFGPEDMKELSAFSRSITAFLVEAAKINANLAKEYVRKFEM